MSDSIYDADYYLRGRETGKSLYKDYRWMPELTVPMVAAIIEHCGILKKDIVLDFGCARGYVVKAFRGLGHYAYGYDVSEWALDNADPAVYEYLTGARELVFGESYDWIIAKDVLEHIGSVRRTILELMTCARKGVFVVVPLSSIDYGRYVVHSYEKDITHIHRLTLPTWAGMFAHDGWEVSACYRVEGIKDNYFKPKWEMGNGFITARRTLQEVLSNGAR